jgi:hypothetical protein
MHSACIFHSEVTESQKSEAIPRHKSVVLNKKKCDFIQISLVPYHILWCSRFTASHPCANSGPRFACFNAFLATSFFPLNRRLSFQVTLLCALKASERLLLRHFSPTLLPPLRTPSRIGHSSMTRNSNCRCGTLDAIHRS